MAKKKTTGRQTAGNSTQTKMLREGVDIKLVEELMICAYNNLNETNEGGIEAPQAEMLTEAYIGEICYPT